MPSETTAAPEPGDTTESIQQARLWRSNGWTARVVKNNDDEGWAVEMLRQGEPEPALVGPWTMGRDKKNPKPLDTAAFNTLVKTASEVIRRHEQAQQALRHKALRLGELRITLDIVDDGDEAHALLAAHDAAGELLARVRVAADFRLGPGSAAAWVESGFARP